VPAVLAASFVAVPAVLATPLTDVPLLSLLLASSLLLCAATPMVVARASAPRIEAMRAYAFMETLLNRSDGTPDDVR
jgi:hypothetical protein